MSNSGKKAKGILIVRLGAMGDILHALPAAASLKRSFPESPVTWIVESRWVPLLEGNPSIDRVIRFERRDRSTWWNTRRELRDGRYSMAVDFQGLLKSAAIAWLAGPDRTIGFHHSESREHLAGWLYSRSVVSRSLYVVDRNLELATAAGATELSRTFYVPLGRPEGDLPAGGFVLASPFAGWASKQWPLESYAQTATQLHEQLGLPLVLNVPLDACQSLSRIRNVLVHVSGLPGLIDATRRATAIIGVDSGPMHLAAALGKPGVALFGPTDPGRNGPCSPTIQVLRSARVVSSGSRGDYIRGGTIDPAMREITPDHVMAALKSQVACHA